MLIQKSDEFVFTARVTKEELIALRAVMTRDMIHNGPMVVSPGIDTQMMMATIDGALTEPKQD